MFGSIRFFFFLLVIVVTLACGDLLHNYLPSWNIAYLQIGPDIGKWDHENHIWEVPESPTVDLRTFPYSSDVKILHKMLLVLRKMGWAKFCSVSGISVPQNQAAAPSAGNFCCDHPGDHDLVLFKPHRLSTFFSIKRKCWLLIWTS